MPGKDGFEWNDLRDFLEGFSSEPFTDLRQAEPLCVSQPQTSLELIPKNLILPHQILVAEQQFLVDRTGDVGKVISDPEQLQISGCEYFDRTGSQAA